MSTTSSDSTALKMPDQSKEDAAKGVPAVSKRARMKWRHWAISFSFLGFVCLPLVLCGYYLYERSVDQFVSRVGFTVRSEDVSAALDILGGLGGLESSGSTDGDILFEYVQNPEIIAVVDEQLDLEAIYSSHFDVDPLFGLREGSTIEDKTRYWRRMVIVSYNAGTGLMEIRVHAFSPEDAQNIAVKILELSSKKINELTKIARSDATLYAREELDKAVERLKSSRQSMTQFRSVNRLIDPGAEIGVQTGLMTALEQQLSDALIESDVLRSTSGANDVRLEQAELRVSIIQQRIEEERTKFGTSNIDGADYSALMGEYESLLVDREFAEQAYLAALAAFDNAQTEAQRTSRYLATYLSPTLAERAEFPQRFLLLSLVAFFLFLTWFILVLVFYSIKDRR